MTTIDLVPIEAQLIELQMMINEPNRPKGSVTHQCWKTRDLRLAAFFATTITLIYMRTERPPLWEAEKMVGYFAAFIAAFLIFLYFKHRP